jgi:uncharacterized Tic20 family protein
MSNEIPLNFRILAAVIHLIGSISPIISIPITWILWMITKESHLLIDQSGRSALNFQSSIALYLVATIGIFSAVCGLSTRNNIIGTIATMLSYPNLLVVSILGFASFSLPIIAAIFTIYGKVYSYPLTIRFYSEAQ